MIVKFEKGHKKVGGKTTGTPNKATKDIKEAYRLLIEDNLPNLNQWLIQIAEKDPEKAIKILSELSEYVIPKLARQELTGGDGKDLFPARTLTKEEAKEYLNKLENEC